MRLGSGASARIAAIAVAAWAMPACSCGDSADAADAGPGDGGLLRDAAAPADATAPLIWVDFSVGGCSEAPAADAGPASGPDSAEQCHGAAPLRLTFVPVAPATVDLYEWSFGDGSDPDRRSTPDHVYAEPGVYDVSLFAQGPGGTAATAKQALVVVSPGATGNPCSADAQCASGACVCGAEPCAGLVSGFCSEPCSGAAPCAEGVCANLAPAAPADPAAWQARLCLADCSAGCTEGQVCRELLRGDGTGWVLGCFAPGLLGDLGASCADQDGALQDELCASGECLAEGMRGLCSASCERGGCPPSAACATFNTGARPPTCLARCGAAACAGDPWLACEAPGQPGPDGFTVDEPASRGGYCAPESCEGNDDCPLGQCQNGYCGP